MSVGVKGTETRCLCRLGAEVKERCSLGTGRGEKSEYGLRSFMEGARTKNGNDMSRSEVIVVLRVCLEGPGARVENDGIFWHKSVHDVCPLLCLARPPSKNPLAQLPEPDECRARRWV